MVPVGTKEYWYKTGRSRIESGLGRALAAFNTC